MKSNWLLIAESDTLSLSSSFYKISFGISKQEQKDLAYVRQYATNNGFYFEKWNIEVAEFFRRIADSLGCSILDINLPVCSGREFVKCLINFGKPPKTTLIKKPMVYISKLFRPSAYFNRQISVLRHAEAKKRKKPKAYSDSLSSL